VLLVVGFRPVVQGDGTGYFSYLHSVVIDHDLDMTDEYAAAGPNGVHVPGGTAPLANTGLPPNQFPIGPAILSLPAYLIALLISPSGQPLFGPPFTSAYTLASLFYGALALALCYRLARRVTNSTGAAAGAITAIALATPLLFYLLYDPSYSHTFSAFTVSFFLYLWWTRREGRTASGWLLLGLVGGLMALVRWQDGPLMAMTLLDIRRARWRLLLMIPGAVLAFSPQIVVDEVIFGKVMPGAASVAFDPLHGHYVQVLFSSWHGLFTWSPVLLAAVVGYWFVQDRALKVAFALCFLIDLAIIGPYAYWWGAASFGMRYFINLTPFFAIGLAALAMHLRPAVLWVGAGVLAAWNLLLMLNLIYVIRKDVDPGYVGLLVGQVQAVPYLPHLVQGYVVRALVLWPLLDTAPDVPGALAMLIAELLVVAAAFWLACSGHHVSALGERRSAGELNADERLIAHDAGVVPGRDRV
jgi:hypothetical protein